MRERRAPSLRRALLLNLLVPTSVLAIALGIGGLVLINKTIEHAYDRVLDGSVKAIAERVGVEDGEITVDLPQVALGMLETRANDSVYYRVSYGGTPVTGYADLPAPDLKDISVGAIRHFDFQYKAAPVRVAAMTQQAYGKPEPVLIEVAETTNGRAAARRELLLILAVLETAIIATAAALGWLAVRRGLWPLIALGHEIDRRQFRSGRTLQPLDLANIPREAHPPVRAMNLLFARLDATMQVVHDFIADASHQMKTPLASLRVHLALLQRDVGHQSKSVEAIAEIEKSTRHLDRLVGQLIAMARAEESAIADRRISGPPADLVASACEVIGVMAPLAATRNVDLAFESDIESAPIRADPAALHDILTNLIDNAIRYNRSGGSVVVHLSTADGRYAARISDDGPGVAPAHRERVFDRFYRLPASTDPTGSGLGLSIVRTLLQQSAGVIKLADGIDGKGLSVLVTFPAACVGESPCRSDAGARSTP